MADRDRMISSTRERKVWLLILFLILGALIGSLISHALMNIVPFMDYGLHASFGPATLDLVVVSLTFGISISLTLGSALGILLGLYLYSLF
jgi:hypothetical protein